MGNRQIHGRVCKTEKRGRLNHTKPYTNINRLLLSVILDAAKYLSGVAEMVGIAIWNINPRYIPPNSLEETNAFHFDGTGNLPHLKERCNPEIWKTISVLIHEDRNAVTLY